MARSKAASDQPPMPVSASGEMLVEKIVPNGVTTPTPPAKAAPPGAVWQVAQSPMAARAAPRLTSAESKLAAAGGAIGAIAGCLAANTKSPAHSASRRHATTATIFAHISGPPSRNALFPASRQRLGKSEVPQIRGPQ